MRVSLFHSLSMAVLTSYVGLLALGASPATAADDGQGSMLGAFIGSVTGANDLLETTPPIEYHERAPLMMPSKQSANTALPPPSETPANRNKAWPNDPDAVKTRQTKARALTPQITRDSSDKLTNEELAQGKIARGASNKAPSIDCDSPSRGCGDPNAIWTPLKQSKAASNDVVALQPGVEPPRDYLTQPPKGYLASQKVAKYTFDAPSKNFSDETTEVASDYYRQQSQNRSAE